MRYIIILFISLILNAHALAHNLTNGQKDSLQYVINREFVNYDFISVDSNFVDDSLYVALIITMPNDSVIENCISKFKFYTDNIYDHQSYYIERLSNEHSRIIYGDYKISVTKGLISIKTIIGIPINDNEDFNFLLFKTEYILERKRKEIIEMKDYLTMPIVYSMILEDKKKKFHNSV